jgi:ABC-2 type transport system permease protein
MRGSWAIIERDMIKYFRSPALIMVSLFLPLLQLLIIGYAFGGKIRDVPVALVDLDHGAKAVELRDRFKSIENSVKTFRIQFEDGTEDAMRAARNGEVAAAIVIPENYSRDMERGYQPQVGLVLDNTDPFVVDTLTQKLSEMVRDVNQPEVRPRYVRQVALQNVEIFPYIEYIQYLLPGSITLAIFVCCLIGGGLLYIDDKARGFHEGYLVTPVSKLSMIFGMIISGTFKATFAGMVVTILGSMIAGISHLFTVSTVLLLTGFNALVSFSLISMISFMMVRVNDPVIPRATFGLLNTLLFFPSGAMYPIYGFPQWLKVVAKVDPFSYAVHGFRAVLLKGVGISAIHSDVRFLAVFSFVCFCGVLICFPRRL